MMSLFGVFHDAQDFPGSAALHMYSMKLHKHVLILKLPTGKLSQHGVDKHLLAFTHHLPRVCKKNGMDGSAACMHNVHCTSAKLCSAAHIILHTGNKSLIRRHPDPKGYEPHAGAVAGRTTPVD